MRRGKSIVGDRVTKAITTDFPKLNINKAVEAVEKFEKTLRGTAQNADAFAKAQGYKSAKNGAFVVFVADLRRYGLLEKRAYASTELAKKIFLAKGNQKNKYILKAINKVALFTNIITKIGKDYENANFQAVLIDNGFSDVDMLKNEITIKNLYKKILPYITTSETNDVSQKQVENDKEGERIHNYPAIDANKQDINMSKHDLYEAILPSDGISIRLPKEKSKIKKVRQLLDWLEEEIEEGKNDKVLQEEQSEVVK